MDNLTNWILSVIGAYSQDMQLASDYYDDLGCHFLDEDWRCRYEISYVLSCDDKSLANHINESIFIDVKRRAVDELDADPDKFEYWVNGTDTWIKYNGEYFSSWQDLEDLINEDKENKNGD